MDYVSQLSHRSIGNLEKLCPLPFENCRIWNKLPCNVEIKTTLKKGIAVHYHQNPELKKRLLYLWKLNLSGDVFSESGRCALYDALFHLLSYIDQLSADNNSIGLTTTTEIFGNGGESGRCVTINQFAKKGAMQPIQSRNRLWIGLHAVMYLLTVRGFDDR